MPTDAIILAGGLGTRLRSVVNNLSKCMVNICGKPFLYYIIKQLEVFGIQTIVLSVGYLYETIEDWISQNKDLFSTEIILSIEKEPLGTGGAIKLALQKTTSNHVIVLNGDTLFDIDINKFFELHSSFISSKISIALKRINSAERYGSVVLYGDKIVSFREKQVDDTGLINGGVYFIKNDELLFDGFPQRFSLENDVLPKLAKEGELTGFVFDDYFIDIGTPKDYYEAIKDFKDKNAFNRYRC